MIQNRLKMVKLKEIMKLLTKEIKIILNDENFPILADVEGGKISRLNKIIDLSIFSQDYFARLYDKNKKSSSFQFFVL